MFYAFCQLYFIMSFPSQKLFLLLREEGIVSSTKYVCLSLFTFTILAAFPCYTQKYPFFALESCEGMKIAPVNYFECLSEVEDEWTNVDKLS